MITFICENSENKILIELGIEYWQICRVNLIILHPLLFIFIILVS